MPEHAPILPVIAAEVAALAPGFRALSLTVEAAPIVRPEIADRAVERACQALARGEPDWAEAHLAAWAEAFRRFGAKPQRTPAPPKPCASVRCATVGCRASTRWWTCTTPSACNSPFR